MKNSVSNTIIPTKIIENLNVIFNKKQSEICVPISTYETPLFLSIQRGANVSKIHPISVNVLNDCMTRSSIIQFKKNIDVKKFIEIIDDKNFQQKTIQKIINKTSKHCKLLKIEHQVIGNLVYLRFSYDTDEASGHNITTIATNEVSKMLVEIAKKHNLLAKYISNSGNTCVDKKNSAINSISGRGKNVVAEIIINNKTCKKILHTTCKKIFELNNKKNLLGSILAGSLCSANAHYANMLASTFLPFGQDIANIVEGSQGITYCELQGENLYFSVNLPNIICGCVGNGKNTDFVKKNMQMIGCINKQNKLVKDASKILAGTICAIVLCGELSLLAALTNENELVKSHLILERKHI